MASSLGTRMFTKQCAYGVQRRHIDQLRHLVRFSAALVQTPVEELRCPTDERTASPPRSPIRGPPTRDDSPASAEDSRIVSPPRDVAVSTELRRSARNRRPPPPLVALSLALVFHISVCGCATVPYLFYLRCIACSKTIRNYRGEI